MWIKGKGSEWVYDVQKEQEMLDRAEPAKKVEPTNKVRYKYPDPDLIEKLYAKFLEYSFSELSPDEMTDLINHQHELSPDEMTDLINHQHELILDLKREKARLCKMFNLGGSGDDR